MSKNKVVKKQSRNFGPRNKLQHSLAALRCKYASFRTFQ